jgi:nicotinamide-nucleotide amidase
MAIGAAALLDADIAVSTTGAGGPGPEEEQPAGTVFIAVTTPDGIQVREFHVTGEPPDIVHAATIQALRDLAHAVTENVSCRTDRVALPRVINQS